MKKLIWIFIAFIFAVGVGLILVGIFSAPPQDKYNAAKKFVEISRNYLEKKPVKPEEIDADEDNNMAYIKEIAEYFKQMQEVEKEYNSVRRRVKVIIEPQNLLNTEAIQRGLAKLEEYDAIVRDMYPKVEAAVAELIADAKKVPEEDLLFSASELEITRNKEAPMREKAHNLRTALGQYFRAILTFVDSRQGFYNFENGRLVFDNEVDQNYYYSLRQDVNKYEIEMDKLMEADKEELRQVLQNIKL